MSWLLLACVGCVLLSSTSCENAVDSKKVKFFVDDKAEPADGVHFPDDRTSIPLNTSEFRVCEIGHACGFYVINPDTSERALYIKSCSCPVGYACVEDRLGQSKYYWIYTCLKTEEITEVAWDPHTETYHLRDSQTMAAAESDPRAARILPDPTTTAAPEQELPRGILELLNATSEDEICTETAFCGFDVQQNSGYSRVGFVKLCTCPEGFECQYHCYQFSESKYHGHKCKRISPTAPEGEALRHLKTEL